MGDRVVREPGRVIVSSLVHNLKASSPISVRAFPKVTEVRFPQFSKVALSSEVMELGRVIEVRADAPKASDPRDVRDSGRVIIWNGQLWNALFPIVFSDIPRSTEVRLWQFEKQLASIEVTESGI